MAQLVHEERLDGVVEELRIFARTLPGQLGFDVMVPPQGGVRFPYQQRALFAQGREMVNGVWRIVDRSKVVTYAEHPEDAPHCHGGAEDLVPVFPDGKIHWAPNDPLFSEYLRRQTMIGQLAQAHGFEWGGAWKWKDWDHIQVPNWCSLPVVADPPNAQAVVHP